MNPLLRKAGILVCTGMVCAYAIVTFRGPHGIPALMEKRRQIEALQEENATLGADNQRRALRVEQLGKHRATQQLEIRKRLKLLKPGETQFILPETKPEPSTKHD